MSQVRLDKFYISVLNTYSNGGERPLEFPRAEKRMRTLGLIGESGSGKSTLGRVVLRLLELDSGSVYFDGQDLAEFSRKEMSALRTDMQVVFQEPYESLNPRMTIGSTVAEPLQIHHSDRRSKQIRTEVLETLERVGLSPAVSQRLPAELSGGQQQRVGIARAIITRPRFVVLDEPTSSLDLTIRMQILDLLKELQQEFEMAYVFVSHDMHTVEWISDRVAVMYRGKIVESAPTRQIFTAPKHAYTRTLLSARLSPDPRERHKYVEFKEIS